MGRFNFSISIFLNNFLIFLTTMHTNKLPFAFYIQLASTACKIANNVININPLLTRKFAMTLAWYVIKAIRGYWTSSEQEATADEIKAIVGDINRNILSGFINHAIAMLKEMPQQNDLLFNLGQYLCRRLMTRTGAKTSYDRTLQTKDWEQDGVMFVRLITAIQNNVAFKAHKQSKNNPAETEERTYFWYKLASMRKLTSISNIFIQTTKESDYKPIIQQHLDGVNVGLIPIEPIESRNDNDVWQLRQVKVNNFITASQHKYLPLLISKELHNAITKELESTQVEQPQPEQKTLPTIGTIFKKVNDTEQKKVVQPKEETEPMTREALLAKYKALHGK